MANDEKEVRIQTCQTQSGRSAELPIEIAELILKIKCLHPSTSFASKQFVVHGNLLQPCYKPLPLSPWIMLGKGQDDNTSRRFFSVEEKCVYSTIKNMLFLQGRCVGSSNGWLAITSNDNSDADHLLNPVSGESIPLPDIGAYYNVAELSNFSGSHILHVALAQLG